METKQLLKLALAMGTLAVLNFNLSAQSNVQPTKEPTSNAPNRWEMISNQAEAAAGELSRVYIQFKPDQKASARALVQTVGGRVHHEFDSLNAMATTVPAVALQGMRNHASVVLVEEDPPRFLLGCDLASEQLPYGIDMVQAQSAGGFTGAGVKIGVIDSGVFTAHPDFAGVTFSGEPAGWDQDGLGQGSTVCEAIRAQQKEIGVLCE